MNRIPLIAGLALLLVTAGCLGIGDTDNESAADDLPDDEDVEDPAENESSGENTTDDSEERSAEDDLPDGEQLLEASTSAQANRTTFQATQRTTIEADGERQTSVQRIWQRSSGEYRMEVIESDQNQTIDMMISNGTTTWAYDETDNEAIRMDGQFGMNQDEIMAFGQNLTDTFLGDMNATVSGTETVADRETYVVELQSEGEDGLYESGTMWIDQETSYAIKFEVTVQSGFTTSTTYEEITFDEEIDDEVFAFEPPEDAEIRSFDELTPEQYESIDGADNATPLDVPRPAVPDGYSLRSASVSENLVGWSATFQYTNETGSFLSVTVAEQSQNGIQPGGEAVEIGNVEATLREDGPGGFSTIRFEADGQFYALSGDLERDELITVAESIVDG